MTLSDDVLGRQFAEDEEGNVVETPILESRPDKTVEEAIEISEEPDIALIAQILSTGPATSQVQHIMSLVPPDRHGCLIRERDGDIFKFQRLGYRIETTDTLKGAEGLHGAGNSRIKVGDVILMTCSRKNKENIEKVEAALVKQKLMMAEDEYEAQHQVHDVPIVNESTFRIMKGLPR